VWCSGVNVFLLQVREEQDLDDFSTHSASIRVAVLLTSEISSPYTECGLRGDNTSGVSPGLLVFGASVWNHAAAGIKYILLSLGKSEPLCGANGGFLRILFGKVVRRVS